VRLQRRLRAIGPGVTWNFVPRGGVVGNREDMARSRTRVEAAVRAGHGLGVSVSLVVRAGPEPSIILEADAPQSLRWVIRVLATAYEPGQWERIRVDPPAPVHETLVAGRRALPGEHANTPPEWGSVTRAAALALAAVRPGTELVCRFSPVTARRNLADLGQLLGIVDAPPVPRFTDRPGGFRPPLPVLIPDAHELLWNGALELRIPPGLSKDDRRRAVGAAEAAWQRVDGFGVSFSRSRAILGSASGFFLSSAELIAVLPPREGGGIDAGPGTVPTTGLPLGRTAAGTVVQVPVEPGQGRHLAILGETGMGKSSLLVGLAVRAARYGGVIMLDPLGETVREVRAELGMEGARALWIAPGASAPSINALEGIGGYERPDPVRSERRVADIVHALRRVRSGRYTDSAFWGPRLEEMLTRAVRAAAAFPQGTLVDAHTLLSTSGLTRRPVPAGAEDVVRELAERIRARPDDADGARRLLHEVARNPTLATMICARAPDLTVREFVRPGRIVLVSGEAARVGEATARYLLAVYLALVWSELLASESKGKTFVLLDEAQWFAHEGLGEMLRLARRRNVHVVLATQSIASLPEVVREAVWTNVADFAAYRGLPEEAREFARAAPGAGAERILGLPRGEAAVLIGKGASVRWVRTARIPRSRSPAGGACPSPDRSMGVRPAAPLPDPSTAIGAVADWLRLAAGKIGSGELLPVALADLRARFPGDPDVVRRMGARLGRARAIRRTERTGAGPVWWLDPTRLAGIDGDDPPSSPDASERPQPS
jgi:uncharacterized protein DUF87